jgi:hypothetical protein
MSFRVASRFLVSLSVLAILLCFGSQKSKAQITPDIACRGLSEDRCLKAIGLLKKALEELKKNYRMIRDVETWEIADPQSLVEYFRLHSERVDGNYGNPTITFAAFFADQRQGVTPYFPNYVIVSTEIIDPDEMKVDSNRMAFVAGFIEGANAGQNMGTVRTRNTR